MIGIVFARESNKYDKTVYSLKSQVESCLERAGVDGVSIEERHVFREQFSGRDLGKMPKLSELRKLLQSTPGRKRVYCYAQDRLFRGRKGYHIFRLLSEFDEWDTEACFILDDVDTSSFAGQFQILFKGQKAATEPDDVLDRTMRGKVKRIKEGKIPGFGYDKYGYTKNNATGKAMINEAEAAVLRRIAGELLSGMSATAVARRLNAEGVPSPQPSLLQARTGRPGRWWPRTLCVILRDPAYKGEGAALRRVTVNGQQSFRSERDWIKLPADCYPPIFTPGEWEQLQGVAGKKRAMATRNATRPALLRGLIFCAVCGRPFYVTNCLVKGKRYIYYRCATVSDRVTKPDIPKCPAKQVPADWIENAAWKKIVEEAADPAKLRAALSRDTEAGNDREAEAELKRLRSELQKRGAQEQNLAREMRDATIAVARVIKEELEKISTERAALRAREAEILRRHTLADERRRKALEVEEMIRGMVKKLPRLKFEQKRIALQELGVRVRFKSREEFRVEPFD